MKKINKKGMFPFLVAFSALSVSGSAAFYSVFGLSKLFAGASPEVIIMAGSLEIAKLVTASLLYQYWSEINKFLKANFTITNLLDHRHTEIIGGPAIGRTVLLRLQTNF